MYLQHDFLLYKINSMKFVAFDLDDTLYKEEDYVKSAFKAIASKLSHNVDHDYFDILLEARKRGENAFDALMSIIPELSIDELLEIYRYHIPELKLPEDSIAILESLKDKAILGLITDGRSVSQRNKISALKLETYFGPDNIIISDEFGSDKHNILNFEYFNKKYSQADQYYYIGDNPSKDFYNANKLGWITIQLDDNGVNIHSQSVEVPSSFKAQFHVKSLKEALNIIIG